MFPENCTKRSGEELEEAVPGVKALIVSTLLGEYKNKEIFQKLDTNISTFLKEKEPQYKWWIYIPEHSKKEKDETHSLEFYVMCEKPDKTFQSFYFKIASAR